MHPWIWFASGGDEGSLKQAQVKLRRQLAQKRLRKAVKGTIMTRKLQREAVALVESAQKSGHTRMGADDDPGKM